MIINSDEDQFLPNEEKDLIHSIIESRAYKEEAQYDSNIAIPLFDQVLPGCVSWICKFMNENGSVSIRNIHDAFDFFIEYDIELKDGSSKEEAHKTAVLFSILSVFALPLPEKLKVSDNEDIIRSHSFKMGIKIVNANVLRVREGFLLQAFFHKLIDNPNETAILQKFIKFAYWYWCNSIFIDQDTSCIWPFSSFLLNMTILKFIIKKQKSCFIIGPPGTSKKFALKLLKKDKNTYITTYMCSRGSSSEGLKAQFLDDAYIQIKKHGKVVNLLEEIGLANINQHFPLKYLHEEVDFGIKIDDAEKNIT